uniref:Uncharacterized protein n=1 Tax=Arundo donax TaxID=35708 RepID=A0A0A9CQ73_ARUDO
MWRSTPPRTW